jgi:hypothetical protein
VHRVNFKEAGNVFFEVFGGVGWVVTVGVIPINLRGHCTVT